MAEISLLSFTAYAYSAGVVLDSSLPLAGCGASSPARGFLFATRMYALTTIVHTGNNTAIHNQLEITSNRIRLLANPENAIQRGRIAVRNAMVDVDKMKTPAILMAKTLRNAELACLAK